MEWSIVGLNFLYAVLGVVLMYLSYRAIDRLTPDVSFPEELKRGNVAVVLSAWTSAAAQRRPGGSNDSYDPLFKKYSKRYSGGGVDWRVFKAQAMAENGLAPDAKSGVGARGLMQLMPTTFREIQTRNPELECIDQPEWNIAAGIGYDRSLWRLYNAGRGTLLRAQITAREKSLDSCVWRNIAEVAPSVKGWRYRETLQYVSKIEAYLAGLKGEAVPP